ncbi:MAG TPA: phosphate acyltransferase, partial [bacterium]|nr:phosphate acyltransferase [bacterium]
SAKDMVTKEMVASMAPSPIIFAMANPDPEITPDEALAARPDAIMATGRSDYPNQVNNVLGFPFIFRGALDVRARKINTEMKLAAVRALAALAREDVPDIVQKAYGGALLRFGPEYIIPKPFDPRLVMRVPVAVAKAAMDTGVARVRIDNLEAYRERLERLLGKSREIMRPIIRKAQRSLKRIVFPEGDDEKILHACRALVDERIAVPILLGYEKRIRQMISSLGLESLKDVAVMNPETFPLFDEYAEELMEMRQRKGINNLDEAKRFLMDLNAFGAMMVHRGDADGLLSGNRTAYSDTIRPALQINGMKKGVKRCCGLYVVLHKNRVVFFADTTVNPDPTAEDLAEIALQTVEQVKFFTDEEPRVAMLSFASFGATRHPSTDKVRRATDLVRAKAPKLNIDGEIQADVALDAALREELFPFSTLKESANVLIFPDLDSANIAYKLMLKFAGAEAIGPILMGVDAPVNVLQRGSTVNEVVAMAAVTAVQAQDMAAAKIPLPRVVGK